MMCCGAILNSGVSTLVMGGRYDPAVTRWADYSVEKLISLTGRSDAIEVVNGILVEPCEQIWNASLPVR